MGEHRGRAVGECASPVHRCATASSTGGQRLHRRIGAEYGVNADGERQKYSPRLRRMIKAKLYGCSRCCTRRRTRCVVCSTFPMLVGMIRWKRARLAQFHQSPARAGGWSTEGVVIPASAGSEGVRRPCAAPSFFVHERNAASSLNTATVRQLHAPVGGTACPTGSLDGCRTVRARRRCAGAACLSRLR